MLKDSIDLHRQGRFDEAEQGYRAQLAEHPDDADSLHLLGMLRFQRGDATEGARLLARARQLAPHDANIEFSVASIAFRNGDQVAAERGFQRALTLDPNLGGAHAGMGQIALLRGDAAAAEQHFKIALRTGEEPHALAGLGALLLERGDADGALRHLARAADLAPNDAMIQMTLGQAFAKRETPAFAETAFENALRLNPGLHQARLWLGALLLKARRFREAETQFRTLLGLPGFVPSAQIGLADLARAEGQVEEAIAGYRAALAFEPNHPMAMRALAWSLGQIGQLDEAIATYDLCLAQTPDDDAVRIARTDLLMHGGYLAQAAAEWNAALERNPADMLARSRCAILSEYLGQPDVASAQADLVLLAQPDAPEMLLIRARKQLRIGDETGARATLQSMQRLDLSEGQHRLCWNYLGRLNDRTGAAAEAVHCFAQAQFGVPGAMPALDDPHPNLRVALALPVGSAWAHAPILLLGTPGSGVEAVAALLADQPQLRVLRDRTGAVMRDDGFNHPRFAHYCGDLTKAECEALRERYLAPFHAAEIPLDRPIVDWLPRWDAHLLALVRRAMPGTRLIIVERDPRDALLNWLAFGWAPGFPCAQPEDAADWLARSRAHLQVGSELGDPRRLVVAADPLFEDAEQAGRELARFLGLDALQPGPQFASAGHGLGGLTARFPAGHWQGYGEALADAFRRLA